MESSQKKRKKLKDRIYVTYKHKVTEERYTKKHVTSNSLNGNTFI